MITRGLKISKTVVTLELNKDSINYRKKYGKNYLVWICQLKGLKYDK